MKRFILFSILLMSTYLAMSQKELINVYLSKSKMYGGTEMSGISTSHAYTFIANKEIQLINIEFEDKTLVLKKGDRMIVYLITHSPYQSSPLVKSEISKNPAPDSSFSSYFRNGKYHVNIKSKIELERAITYRYKSKEHVALLKTEVDFTQEHYAP